MAYNFPHACPELVRKDASEMLDCCAHDMWGAGYLMHTAFTNTSPWAMTTTGNEFKDGQTMCDLHSSWVCSSVVSHWMSHQCLRPSLHE